MASARLVVIIAFILSASTMGAVRAGADAPEERYAAISCERHGRLGSNPAPNIPLLCPAVGKTDEYLHVLGMELDDAFSVEFREVAADTVGSSHGIADVRTSTIQIYRWPGKIAWGLEWIPPMVKS